MIARIKRRFEEWRRLGELMAEGRALLQALELPSAQGNHRQIAIILMNIGVGRLRVWKKDRDAAKAARELDARIKDPAAPRPTYGEAGLN